MIRGKEGVISTEAVNEVGSRVLTAGIDYSQYERNPVLLYMHERGGDTLPIGRVESLHVEDGRLIGTPVFDESNELEKRIAHKWESGILRMMSPKLEILESSNAPEMVLQGQTRETVTRCKLVEVSVVDIGGNDEALQLSYKGKVVELSSGASSDALPLLPLKNENPDEGKHSNNNLNQDGMKNILLALGLADTATSEQGVAAAKALQEKAARVEAVELAAVAGAVDAAVADRRITADQKDHFLSLGKAVGVEHLSKTLSLMKPAVKPMDVIDPTAGGSKGELALKWADLTPETAEKLKRENPKQYMELYKAEFGVAPTLNA